MKPSLRKKLKQKIDESIHEVIAKHDEKRRRELERVKAVYSPKGLDPQATAVVLLKYKRLKPKDVT